MAADPVRRERPCLGIVTGLSAEADCLTVFDAAVRPRVRCAGIGPAAAAGAAAALLDDGCTALLSFGCAGGLDPRLTSGTVVVATGIVRDGGAVYPTDTDWRMRLLAVLESGGGASQVIAGRLFGSDRPLADPDHKQALGRRLAALCVDMESHAVAEVAAARGVPMLAMRAVCDTAEATVPAWLAGVIDASGKPRLPALLAGLATHPSDLGRLLRLAGSQRAALSGLRRVALRGGPLLALG